MTEIEIIREIAGQACGIFVLVYSVVAAHLPKRWMILVGATAGNFFAAMNQLLVGSGLTACFACLMATINCPINAYKAKKGIPTKKWENILWAALYILAWAAGFGIGIATGTASALDLMTLVTTIFFIGHVLSTDEKKMRWYYLGNGAVFMVYDAINLNISALAKLFSVISTLMAIFRFKNKEKRSTD